MIEVFYFAGVFVFGFVGGVFWSRSRSPKKVESHSEQTVGQKIVLSMIPTHRLGYFLMMEEIFRSSEVGVLRTRD